MRSSGIRGLRFQLLIMLALRQRWLRLLLKPSTCASRNFEDVQGIWRQVRTGVTGLRGKQCSWTPTVGNTMWGSCGGLCRFHGILLLSR